MHLHRDKRVGPYLGNYLFTVFCVLIFIQIDSDLHIASKRIKLIRTNMYKVLQFNRVMYQSIQSLTIPPGNFFDGRIPRPLGKKGVQNPHPWAYKNELNLTPGGIFVNYSL